MAVLSALEPKNVFAYFEKLCSVPHGSGNTKQISDLCISFAKELGLACRQDAANNVIIWKPASPGYENAAPVILQGHMDMVCAKEEGCAKDMAAEGLDLQTDGEWVWANQTSLGADNCIAVAIALAILADNALPHPPLEAIFTTEEETGMDGAKALDCSDLKGRQFLNLDSEGEGVFTVSCAGGLRADCTLPGSLEPVDSGAAGFAVTISGLKGGHSGGEIHKGRGSANQLMVRTLFSAMERIPGLRLADIQGGQFDNVICTQNEAKVSVPSEKAAKFTAFIHEFNGILRNEYTGCDDGVTLTCAPAAVEQALPAKTTSDILHTLLALPQGVLAMSADFPDLVQTSLNFGMISLNSVGLQFTFSVRSSMESQKEMVLQRIRATVEFGGGTVSVRSSYPSWQFVRDSAMRDRLVAVYHSLTGKEAVVQGIHGGLECGLFVEKMPGLDAVSFGPEMHDIHSPQERLSVASTHRTYALVCEFLKQSGV